MLSLQALIFDVDGTLAETERDGHRVAFNQAFAAADLDWAWPVEQYGDLLKIAGGKERIRFFWQTYQPQFRPALPKAMSEQAWIAELHRAKSRHYTQLLQTGKIALRPGVRRLLLEARQSGVRLAIATTSTFDNVTALLEATLGAESIGWFEVIAAGDVVEHKKPAPDVYQYVLQQMQLDPQQSLVIEDSDVGLQAARQAGLPTVVTVNPYTQKQDFSAANLVLNHLGEPALPFKVLQGRVDDRASFFDLALADQVLKSL
jgi:HAD superfamily hydrolase (TIGR01509 family)